MPYSLASESYRQTGGKYCASDNNNESGEKDVAGKVKLICGYDNRREGHQYPHARGEPARKRKILIYSPDERAATQVVTEPASA
jgi:hypothetical protein